MRAYQHNTTQSIRFQCVETVIRTASPDSIRRDLHLHAAMPTPSFSLTTERLLLRELDEGDAPFVLELINEPGWIRYIGDRGIRDLDGARDYIVKGPVAMYRQHGFGLYAVVSRETGEPLGLCGLIKRETLDDVDIGFAFLERHGRKGYAFESASAVLAHAREVLALERIVAITSLDNHASMKLLQKIGLHLEKVIPWPGSDETVNLFATP